MTIHFSRNIHARYSQIRLIAALAFAIVAALSATAQSKRRVFAPGRPGVVFDERLSALRAQPNVKAPLEQRMRRGRRVGILGATIAKDGAKFFRVAISRNTRGWVLADAVIRPGNAADAERLMRLIVETKDEFTKARLAKLYADEFRSTKLAPKALMILAESAEGAAERLSRDARRRVGDDDPDADMNKGLTKRDFKLNYVGLDRYNRIGVMFDYDAASDRIVYDGAAYRELARRYPRSDEAQDARKRLEILGKR
ncbi:MAG: SH3 domain-containing protein [Acidobacteria bacterium]|nr:SH3 domain-containing protein [Acidobacteriota bacterium]